MKKHRDWVYSTCEGIMGYMCDSCVSKIKNLACFNALLFSSLWLKIELTAHLLSGQHTAISLTLTYTQYVISICSSVGVVTI